MTILAHEIHSAAIRAGTRSIGDVLALNDATLRLRSIPFALIVWFSAGCASQSPVKTVEMLDQRTGMTMGALPQPMAFIETGIYDLLVPDKQPSMVYIGPVEWDRSGDFSYLLWVQVAPGVGGHRFDDIRASGALSLKLDDGPMTLSALDIPVAASSPYRPQSPVGQTAYFPIDVALLKRMAASQRIALNIRAGDLSMVDFIPLQETRAALKQFIRDRGIN
jgi:hypothetical protein